MRWLWKRFRQGNLRSAGSRFSGTVKQVIGGQLIVISKAGEPVPKVLPSRPKVQRPGRGSLRGCIRISASFDEQPTIIAEAFGMR
ncbi:type II toxin-antitoxin system Phd/YefM family antitoxin [Streptomyces sp. NPDC004044]